MCDQKFSVGDFVRVIGTTPAFGIISHHMKLNGTWTFFVRFHGEGEFHYGAKRLVLQKTSDQVKEIQDGALRRLIDFADNWDVGDVYIDPFDGKIKAEVVYSEQKKD